MPRERQPPAKPTSPRHKAARPSCARKDPRKGAARPTRKPTHKVVACTAAEADFHGGKLVPVKPPRAKKDRGLPAGPADTEQTIIESLADPVQRVLTVGQRCELIGISRRTWYRHLEDPLFKARAAKAYRQCCNEELSAVLDALIASAKLLGKDGHADRKLFLELLGEYQPGSGGRGGDGEEPKKPTHRMSDEELLAAFEDKPHLLPVGVLRRLGKDPDAASDEKARVGVTSGASHEQGRKKAA